MLCSCQYYNKLPNQDKAVDLIWRSYYGQTVYPPAIEWRTDRCGDRMDKYAAVYQNMCYGGLFLFWEDHILVAQSNDGKIWNSALPHELMHAKQWNDNKVLDYEHTSPEWTLVGVVNNDLKERNW